ncbi:MAG: hypothetical protein ACI9K3_000729 [Halovenus sp.]|jgi:hypothetical protein
MSGDTADGRRGDDDGRSQGGSSREGETVRPEEVRGGDLPPREVDRMLDLLEEVIAADALTSEQFDRLVNILTQAVETEPRSSPEAIAELLSIFEEFLLDPEQRRVFDVDRLLGLLETVVTGATATDPAAVEDLFDVIAETLREPTGADSADVDRFESAVQRALSGLTDPVSDADTGVDPTEEHETSVDLLRLAEFVATVTRRVAGNSLESGVRVGTRLAYAAANAESPAALLTAARVLTFEELRRVGVDIGVRRTEWLEENAATALEPQPPSPEELAERGDRLLSQSTAVDYDESVHPALGSILDQLSPDEARILRLLATEGPQGVIDVYDREYVPPKRWRVARNLTMLGRDAGSRLKQRTPVYLRNLRRLGVVEVVDEPIESLKRYEIIEAQTHVEQARDRARRPRTEYKQVRLTDLGVELCVVCFPFEVTVDGEGLALRDRAGGSR